MDQTEAGNPYQAPEASIAALRAEIQRPPVYSAISLLCWAIAGFQLLGVLVFLTILIRNGFRLPWGSRLMPGNDLIGYLILGSGATSTVTYVTAGRWLRENRGRVGLMLCCFAIGLTYLTIWLVMS